ncbi:quinone oxidoreductase family protein [Rhodococcus opacus]|uniref:quinone oxidoreductase family protein n=1 Tax=Rhodococcus opacus TaxID=37919 RepID=UPI000EAA5FE6|nr:NADP-dependent oxidoreductase [Rhodococcus opacus]QZS52692.1 NADP-dependent oxidoreductase [Rhodococcus opacus]RKM65309.1 alcohol dehydrogenase [Rhodococcus opacus]
MFAVQFNSPGHIDVLQVRDIPVPSPGEGEVLVALEASAINPADVKIRSGIIPLQGSAPFTLGYDLVGTVKETGPHADRFLPGARVIGASTLALTGNGTWSEFVCLPETSLARAPEGIDPAVLAQLPLPGLTAMQAVDALQLTKESDVLVAGAAGAVGRIALQLLRLRGHRAHALVRRDEQAEMLPTGVAEEVYTGSLPESRFDGVIDTAGIDLSAALRPGGHYVTVVPGSPPHSVSEESATLVITHESGAMLHALTELLTAGELSIPESKTFSFSEIEAAHHEYDRQLGRRITLVV